MKRLSILTLLSLLCITTPELSIAQGAAPIKYSTPDKLWEESLGNHRAVLSVAAAADAVALDLEWRRRDANPDKRQFLIIDAASGDTVRNIQRREVNSERCELVFGPVTHPGTYYFYYLPYPVVPNQGSYGADYLTPEAPPAADWVAALKPDIPQATVEAIESRTAFDSFYPMEVVLLSAEHDNYIKANPSPMLLFAEDRSLPIRMKEKLPQRWIGYTQGSAFSGTGLRNEYYAYQVGVYAAGRELKDLKVEWSDMSSANGSKIAADQITCFNTEGYKPSGEYFTKTISVDKGRVQPLWMGVDIKSDTPAGVYRGTVTVSAAGVEPQSVPVEITVTGDILADRGDSEPWRHSRLRWLNSRAGISNEPTRGYSPIERRGDRLTFTGRDMRVGANGLPASITAGDREILAAPAEFVITTDQGVLKLRSTKPRFVLDDTGRVEWISEGSGKGLKVSCRAALEFDGWINYIYTITPERDITVKDIRLNIPMRGDVARYMMGMGLEGGNVPTSHSSKWHGVKQNISQISTTSDAPVKLDGPMDSFWVGDAHGGLHCELRGASYTGPLLNLYQPAPPVSWNNEGRGGFEIGKANGRVVASAYSGERELKAGEDLVFDFALTVTPVKKIDYRSQFTDRYYHNGAAPVPTDEDVAAGVRVINVHHANYINPYINYPFLTTDTIRAFTDRWHAKGTKVKLYYTIRELTNSTPEIWALRSLGDEILSYGSGGGYPWLREHFEGDYVPQWYAYLGPDQSADASVVNAPGESRWYNYYVEGLGWMVRNLGIDGIYLDDVTYGRDMLKRMRRVMDAEREGCIIDLHSNTGFSRGPVLQYAEFFPFVDKLWFGESFYYNSMAPENWLVEVSGIPFGLMGDMLHRGGNRWRGMVYGMTVRHPWITDGVLCDPRPIWAVWDSFGIADSRMIGYWEPDAPVRTSNDKVLATTYINPRGEVLVSVASWAPEVTDFELIIDWKALGIDPAEAVISQPEVEEFQPERSYAPGDKITVEPTQGFMFIIK